MVEGACAAAVGGIGRAPGCGGGGSEESAVVVAGTEAGTVRVGVGVVSASSEAVFGVVPSGLMGAFLWIGMGGMVGKCARVVYRRLRLGVGCCGLKLLLCNCIASDLLRLTFRRGVQECTMYALLP